MEFLSHDRSHRPTGRRRRKLGLRKNFVLEAALREKLEDLLDAADLREAMKEATGFHAWEDLKREARRGGKK